MEFKVGDKVRVTEKFLSGLHNLNVKNRLKIVGVVDSIGDRLLLVKFFIYSYWLFDYDLEHTIEIGTQLEFDFMNKEL